LRFLEDDENGEKERKSIMMAFILYLGALQYNTLFLRSCLLEQGS
jgi:hypothetical protein